MKEADLKWPWQVISFIDLENVKLQNAKFSGSEFGMFTPLTTQCTNGALLKSYFAHANRWNAAELFHKALLLCIVLFDSGVL